MADRPTTPPARTPLPRPPHDSPLRAGASACSPLRPRVRTPTSRVHAAARHACTTTWRNAAMPPAHLFAPSISWQSSCVVPLASAFVLDPPGATVITQTALQVGTTVFLVDASVEVVAAHTPRDMTRLLRSVHAHTGFITQCAGMHGRAPAVVYAAGRAGRAGRATGLNAHTVLQRTCPPSAGTDLGTHQLLCVCALPSDLRHMLLAQCTAAAAAYAAAHHVHMLVTMRPVPKGTRVTVPRGTMALCNMDVFRVLYKVHPGASPCSRHPSATLLLRRMARTVLCASSPPTAVYKSAHAFLRTVVVDAGTEAAFNAWLKHVSSNPKWLLRVQSWLL